jgi:hypothetical protein
MNMGASGARHLAAPGVRSSNAVYAPETQYANVDDSTAVERWPSPRANDRSHKLHENQREVELPPSSGNFAVRPFRRFYEPDSVRVMTDALDIASRMLPVSARTNESLRRRLALHIMRELDAGERDPDRLATTAVLSMRL